MEMHESLDSGRDISFPHAAESWMLAPWPMKAGAATAFQAGIRSR
jgi:hypothetical protein